MTPSAFVRAQALKGRVVIQQGRTLDHAVFDALRRIGLNLNQLTRIAHKTRELPPGLSRLCIAIEQLLIRELGADDSAQPSQADGPKSRP